MRMTFAYLFRNSYLSPFSVCILLFVQSSVQYILAFKWTLIWSIYIKALHFGFTFFQIQKENATVRELRSQQS